MGEGKLKDKIKQRDYKLQSLLEITKAINANLSVEDLVQQYRSTLSDQLHIPQILLFIFDENPTCWIQHGFSELAQWETHVNQLHRSATIKIQTIELDQSHVVVIPIEKDGVPIAFVILGDGDEELIEMSPSLKHMRFVQTLTGVLVVAIQNKTLIEQTIAQAAIKRELQLAAEMQNMLLPKHLPKTNSLLVDAYYKSHGQVGGDYYDFIQINEHEWICCMADVSGKGVSAAFLMAGLQAQLRGLIESYGCDLEKIISALNTKVLESAQGEKFVTFFIGHYHSKNQEFSYINCGHNPGFVFHDNANTWMNAQIPALGIIDSFLGLKKNTLHLSTGTHILLYTDGLVEVENEMLQPFGEMGISEAFEQWGQLFSNVQLMEKVNDYKGKMKFIDDIALLHILINEP